jgi:hypothetical protein
MRSLLFLVPIGLDARLKYKSVAVRRLPCNLMHIRSFEKHFK